MTEHDRRPTDKEREEISRQLDPSQGPTINLTVNQSIASSMEFEYEIPFGHNLQRIMAIINAADTLHPDWSSMVLTFSNPNRMKS